MQFSIQLNTIYVSIAILLFLLLLIIIINIIIMIIIIIITITDITISIIVFVKSAWRICWIRLLSPATLVSHDFWRQISAYVFLLTFSLFQRYNVLWIKVTWTILFWNLICSKRSSDWNETISKYIQISIYTGKRLWWRPFGYKH